ncbi:tRNA (N6-isopentenyl adenosine(37)-C2)-methylthiotransferase MiaB [Anaerovorax odorimutans]|uniref:tRNA (N6-isopentenyl adenosine(37)-C2)-methylthiotransferase MiaB n=1 Tax=Anaerovorax odorimutans TaxID=109327 RepID=UPI0004129668|nr:tRNA (N6-isopentenyl adenosine(37)-C2)-methylthiotransferase MiaB [Anaerovorax odorimutans]
MEDNREKFYSIVTLGCQMNEHDSEILAGMLEKMGYAENKGKNDKDIDIAIINTCSVRENADKRFFGMLGQLKKSKENNTNMVVAVCGCMMQQQHIVDTVKSKYPWVDLVFGTHNIHEFPKLLTNILSERKKIIDVWEDGCEIIEGLPSKRLYPFKALVDVMTGCNNFCTYCIVPYTRGREKSRNMEEILKEVRNLAADGVKEVMLLGQNVNSYQGTTIDDSGNHIKTDFADLIYKINDIEGIERIRFMTSHPKDLSDKLIQAYGDCDKLCNHIHLPVQSGSGNILKRMNRKYTKDDYLLLVKKLKKTVPEIAITTDIIVGFPGETEEDFNETLDLVGKVRYDSAFTFLYSIRKGTPAESFKDQVPEHVKHDRFNRLVDLLNGITLEKNKAYEGKLEKVLVEGSSKTNNKTFTGRTESSKIVNFQGNKDMVGKIINVRVKEGKTFSLFGEIE